MGGAPRASFDSIQMPNNPPATLSAHCKTCLSLLPSGLLKDVSMQRRVHRAQNVVYRVHGVPLLADCKVHSGQHAMRRVYTVDKMQGDQCTLFRVPKFVVSHMGMVCSGKCAQCAERRANFLDCSKQSQGAGCFEVWSSQYPIPSSFVPICHSR
jgi:hypothetical protein